VQQICHVGELPRSVVFAIRPQTADLTNADLRQRLDAAEHRLDDALAAQRKATDALKDLQAAG
jgi:hypothetical protein